VPSVPFFPVCKPGRDDPAQVAAVNENDMEHEAVHLTDRPHARFAVILSIVRPFDRVTLENQAAKSNPNPRSLRFRSPSSNRSVSATTTLLAQKTAVK